jgi:acyl-CoA reductase-like NAD-dependent aldehyde dehydrogenase
LRIDAPGRVCLVLGAGNVTSIALLDVLYKLVAENSVCFLKVHALLSPLTPVLQDVLAPLVDSGYLSVASGGAAEGAYLCEHPLVDAIHITGSAATYRSIAQSTAKPITSELGNVSPAIVLPGRWSERDIEFVAEQIVSAKLHNDGCNCIALQVLVLSTQWPQRAALLAAIARLMRRADERPAYYPGSVQRFASFAAGRGTVRSYGHSDAEHIAPSIAEVDAADVGEPLFREEVFCPLLAATALEGDVPTYLRAAVRFCNDRVAGNLAANIFADSVTMRQWAHEIEAAVAELRYGCVGVNVWSGVAFLLPALPWGGFSGNTPERIGSGIGVVHNTRLFARPQKSVLYGPFRPFPRRLKPPWFVTQRHRAQIGEALCRYQDRGSPFALARIAWLSLRG